MLLSGGCGLVGVGVVGIALDVEPSPDSGALDLVGLSDGVERRVEGGLDGSEDEGLGLWRALRGGDVKVVVLRRVRGWREHECRRC